MCGRFYLTFFPDAEHLFEELFGIPFPEFGDPPILSDDILPFSEITTIQGRNGERPLVRTMFWNLVPYYEKEFKPRHTWFNIRKEKLTQPYNKQLVQRRRCIVPVSGFLENKEVNGKPVFHSRKIGGKTVRKKESYAFRHKVQPLMALGAIYDTWNKDEQGPRYSCSIITLEPNSLIAAIHPRMPFILPREKIRLWLDPAVDDFDFLFDLIEPFPESELRQTQRWPGEAEQGRF